MAADAARDGLTPLGRWAADAAGDARLTAAGITAQGEQAAWLRHSMPPPSAPLWDEPARPAGDRCARPAGRRAGAGAEERRGRRAGGAPDEHLHRQLLREHPAAELLDPAADGDGRGGGPPAGTVARPPGRLDEQGRLSVAGAAGRRLWPGRGPVPPVTLPGAVPARRSSRHVHPRARSHPARPGAADRVVEPGPAHRTARPAARHPDARRLRGARAGGRRRRSPRGPPAAGSGRSSPARRPARHPDRAGAT